MSNETKINNLSNNIADLYQEFDTYKKKTTNEA